MRGKHIFHASFFLIWISAFSVGMAGAETLHNPVARVADAGILKHRGNYYLSGVGLPGQFIHTTDLINWRGPWQVVTRESNWPDSQWNEDSGVVEMTAPCLAYYNGIFHFYFNGIGHAIAPKAMGPYHEPILDKPFTGEIDPFLFQDHDGDFYFYSTKFPPHEGNTNWGQTMADPNTLTSEPVKMIVTTPGTWETQTGRIAEGPEVLRYRDHYYMLYAGNHTGIEYGTYATGCATAATAMGFSNATKYPGPVLESSEFRIDRQSEVLVQTGAMGGPAWRFTFEKPAENWAAPNFEVPENWQSGFGGFGHPLRPESRVHRVRTVWEGMDIWMRLDFELQEKPSAYTQLKLRLLDRGIIYLNGIEVFRCDWIAGPRLAALPQAAVDSLKPGRNTLAVHCNGDREERYADVGLIDPGDHHEDQIVWNLGQPSVVRGPNGFEWFHVYFALWDEGPHSQGINRLQFADRRLYVDGPTGNNPAWYQPEPYAANFADRFDTHRYWHLGDDPEDRWEYRAGWWQCVDEAAKLADFFQTDHGLAFPRTEPGSHYLFQIWARSFPENEKPYGAMAFYQDDDNKLEVLLSPEKHALLVRQTHNGEITVQKFPLPFAFSFEAWQKIRVLKNGAAFDIFVGNTCLTLDAPILTPFAGKGRVGIFLEGMKAAFDGILYTRGWDEFDKNIRHWTTPQSIGQLGQEKAPTEAKLKGTDSGLVLDNAFTLKGDPLNHYEFTVYAEAQENGRPAILPLYADAKNWLLAEVDEQAGLLKVYGKKDGKDAQTWTAPIQNQRPYYTFPVPPEEQSAVKVSASHCWEGDSVAALVDGAISESSQQHLPKHTFWDHRGGSEWLRQDFPEAVEIKGSEIIWYDDRRSGGECRVPESWRLEYLDGKDWKPVQLLDGEKYGTAIDQLHLTRFAPVKTAAVRMIVNQQEGFGSGAYEWNLLRKDQPGRPKLVEFRSNRSGLVSRVDLRFRREPPFQAPTDLELLLLQDGQWQPAQILEKGQNPNGAHWLRIQPARAEKIRIRHYAPAGKRVQLLGHRLNATIEAEPGYHFRTVRLPEKTLLFLDGRQLLEIPGAWPAAQVGLAAAKGKVRFDGITRFWIAP